MKHRIFFAIALSLIAVPLSGSSDDSIRGINQPTTMTAVRPDENAIETGSSGTAAASELTPQEAQAEKVKKEEQDSQSRLSNTSRAVEDLEKRLAELRKQAGSPPRMEVEKLEHDLGLVEQELNRVPVAGPSPLIQVQRSDLQERVFQMQVSTEIMKRRWEGGWKVFGTDFFSSVPPELGGEYGPLPASYRVRVGDRLNIVVSSALGAESSYSPVVDSGGRIFLPGAGSIPASGKTADQIKSTITKRLETRFRQLAVSVSVEKLQSIRVQITGEVARPGTYTLTGAATVLTALYQAGGPTKTGSFRKIRLNRSGSPSRPVDLYELLIDGSKKLDYALEDGDLLFVPPVGGTIVVEGEVVRPCRYEPDFPITLAQALKLAGGVNPGAYVQSVQVERVENGENRLLLNEPLTSMNGKGAFALKPGDQVTVVSIRPDRTNQVEITGPVGLPGLYGLKQGMRVSDLIKLAQGLVHDKEVYGGRADILRIDPLSGTRILTFDLTKALACDPANDLVLSKLDRVFIYRPEQVVFRPRLVTVKGAVARPGTYNRTDGMSIRDAVAAAGGVLPNAFLTRADILHTQEDGRTELEKVDLRAALTGDAGKNSLLRDRDSVVIYSQDEAQWSDKTVRIEGAVQRPGEYTRPLNMHASDLIFAAGGLLPEAADHAELARGSTGGESRVSSVKLASLAAGGDADPLLMDRDVLTVPAMNPSLRAPEIVYITGEVARPGPYSLNNRSERLSDLIRRAGGLTKDADMRGLLFLRQKESFENEQQAGDADLILQKSRAFSDKQFLTHLAKLGVGLPGQFIQAVQQSTDRLAKPTEVVAEKKLTDGAEHGGSESDRTAAETTGATSTGVQLFKSGGKAEEPTTSAMGPAVEDPAHVADAKPFAGRKELAILEESARVSVDLMKAFKDPDSADNIPMRRGDRVFIPKITNIVTVIGAVLHPHPFAAAPGETVDHYIELSGGFAQDASKGNVVVVRSNGDALPKAKVRSVEPGDMIVVPTTGMIDIAKKWERIGPVAEVLSSVLSSVYVLTHL